MGEDTRVEALLEAAEKAKVDCGKSSYWSVDVGLIAWEGEEIEEYFECCDPWTVAHLCRHAIKTGIKLEEADGEPCQA